MELSARAVSREAGEPDYQPALNRCEPHGNNPLINSGTQAGQSGPPTTKTAGVYVSACACVHMCVCSNDYIGHY